MPGSSKILARHAHLNGSLRVAHFRSRSLGIRKPYYVYQSAGWKPDQPFNLIWLFRGHEREWVNFREDQSREQTTAIEDLDALIDGNLLPQSIAIMPGLASANNWVPSAGMNMVGSWKPSMRGLGQGKFNDYLLLELIPYIEKTYNPLGKATRSAFGFSLGGYIVQMLSVMKPGYLQHAAMYDALFMWPGHIDPRGDEPCSDSVWLNASIFDPALGKPRNTQALDYWNTTDMLVNADEALLNSIKSTKFWINSAAGDGSTGNIDRSRFMEELMASKGISNQCGEIPLDVQARHNWHWNDVFFSKVLSEIAAVK